MSRWQSLGSNNPFVWVDYCVGGYNTPIRICLHDGECVEITYNDAMDLVSQLSIAMNQSQQGMVQLWRLHPKVVHRTHDADNGRLAG